VNEARIDTTIDRTDIRHRADVDEFILKIELEGTARKAKKEELLRLSWSVEEDREERGTGKNRETKF